MTSFAPGFDKDAFQMDAFQTNKKHKTRSHERDKWDERNTTKETFDGPFDIDRFRGDGQP